MDTMFTEFQSYVTEAEVQIKTVLRLAVGGDAGEEAQEEAETILPPAFKKQRLSDYDGQPKAFLSWMLDIVEPKENSNIEIKDLVEKGKVRGFSEKFIRSQREIFNDDVWGRGGRFIQGVAWK